MLRKLCRSVPLPGGIREGYSLFALGREKVRTVFGDCCNAGLTMLGVDRACLLPYLGIVYCCDCSFGREPGPVYCPADFRKLAQQQHNKAMFATRPAVFSVGLA